MKKMSTPFDNFCNTLKNLFMLDVSEDLDFGIYRIMNLKKHEVRDFLNNRLKNVVQSEISANISSDYNAKQKELDDLVKQLTVLGAPVDSNPNVIKLRSEINSNGNSEDLESEVYTYLNTFFSRYYDKGDFISQRRYKKDVYAIPYEGEEVKLYWANSDQYYIKTAEYFRNYRFSLHDGKQVEFTLKDATTEQNNNKTKRELTRRFRLWEEQPIEITEDGVLHINFTYELMPKAFQQGALLKDAFATIKERIPQEFNGLFAPCPTEKDRTRTLLQKHLKQYTERNTNDYFIHKNLKQFLQRELDFFIKNEVFYIDDITSADVNAFANRITKIKVIQKVGQLIISLLSQLEEYQKRLWLKQKFVISSDYLITLDRVPTDLYPEICLNDKQREEWIRLFAIDQIKGTGDNLIEEGKSAYSEPLTEKFLMENPTLVLDTALFPTEFKNRLLSGIDNLDAQCNGVLVHSENFQALRLLGEKYGSMIKCIYIDPPYNTGSDDFVYKDNYQDSCWLSLMNDRLQLSRSFFGEGGCIAVSIDIKELDKLIALLDMNVGNENRRANITNRRASISGAKVINPGLVNISENVVIYSNGIGKWKPQDAFRERVKGFDNRYGKMILNVEDDPQKWEFSTVLEEFSKVKNIPKSKLKKQLGDNYADELLKFAIKHADSIFQFVPLDEDSVGEKVVSIKNESQKNPERIYILKRDGENLNDYYIKNGKAILFYKDRIRRIGDRLVPVEKVSDIWDDVLPNDIHNEGGVVLKKGKKPEKLIDRIFQCTSNQGDYILDYFAGSATSGAVALKSQRKFINIESNVYFDSITLRRIKNTLYGDKSGVSGNYLWKGGGMVKYMRLEQYEDSLNNIQLADKQLSFQSGEKNILGYKLDVESRESIFSSEWFADPFNVGMKVTRKNECREETIDMVETFNHLIGLFVEKIVFPEDGVEIVIGTTRRGERTIVIWRNKEHESLNQIAEYLTSMGDELKSCRRIFINGENNLAALLPEVYADRIYIIEPEFKKRMFDA